MLGYTVGSIYFGSHSRTSVAARIGIAGVLFCVLLFVVGHTDITRAGQEQEEKEDIEIDDIWKQIKDDALMNVIIYTTLGIMLIIVAVFGSWT